MDKMFEEAASNGELLKSKLAGQKRMREEIEKQNKLNAEKECLNQEKKREEEKESDQGYSSGSDKDDDDHDDGDSKTAVNDEMSQN